MIKSSTVITLEDIIERAKALNVVYDSLTPEQQQEVDNFNDRLIKAVDSGDPAQVDALGISPMMAYMAKRKVQ
jgi:hypothetical protein